MVTSINTIDVTMPVGVVILQAGTAELGGPRSREVLRCEAPPALPGKGCRLLGPALLRQHVDELGEARLLGEAQAGKPGGERRVALCRTPRASIVILLRLTP